MVRPCLVMALIILVFVLITVAIGLWWRYRSLACPAGLSWLLDNPYMNAVAGPESIIHRSRLQKGMRLLDVGSGPGRLALPAAKLVGETGEVVALDIQARMLDKLRRRAEQQGVDNIRLVKAGAGEGQVDEDYFDRVWLVTVLGEIADKDAALAEIHRALKAGGILSITEVIPDPHYTSRSRLRALCVAAGFEETESFGGRLAFTINFRKSNKSMGSDLIDSSKG